MNDDMMIGDVYISEDTAREHIMSAGDGVALQEWPTVAQAAKLIGIIEQGVRRLIDDPLNAARTRPGTPATAIQPRPQTTLHI